MQVIYKIFAFCVLKSKPGLYIYYIYIYVYNACSSVVTHRLLMMPCFWGQASGRPAGLQWPTATRVMFGGMACLVETDVEAALVHGHFQLLFVILVATQRLALERER